MKAIFAAVGCAGLSFVLAAPTYAQNTTATTPATAPHATVTTMTTQEQTAPNGSLEQYHGEWRASKLVGSNVYNQLGEVIGSVDDLMLGSDGKVDQAVLSVGGFLGIGGKLVAVPFDQFKFVESKRNVAAKAPVAVPAATVATPAPAPAVTTMVPARPMNQTAVEPNPPGQPVYYSLVLPDATKNSLTSAAGFKYNG